MNIKFAMIGLAALGGAAMASGTASAARPNGLPPSVSQIAAGETPNVENVRLVCDVYGRCFRTAPRFYGGGYGYGRPRFYGGGPRFYGGGGYGRPRFYGGRGRRF